MTGMSGELILLLGVAIIIVAIVIASKMGNGTSRQRNRAKKDMHESN